MSIDTRLIGSKPLYFPPPDDGMVVTNYGSDTIYYGGASVSASSYTGTLSSLATTTLTAGYYFVCPTGQSLLAIDQAKATGALDDTVGALEDDVTTLQSDTSSLQASLAKTKGVAVHGSTADYARPTGFASIEWLGSVEPTNAETGDTWVDTSDPAAT
jgi:hypothetical protein